MIRFVRFLFAVSLILAPFAPACAAVDEIVARAQNSARSENASAHADLANLIDALRNSRDMMDQMKLIEAVSELGDTRGTYPAAVKDYIRTHAPGVLIAIVESKADWAVRGNAAICLRTINADDAFIDRAIALAEANTGAQRDFAREQAQNLRDWQQARKEGRVDMGPLAPFNKASEQAALDYLRANGFSISYDALVRAIGKGDVMTVDALMVAGVPVTPNVNQPASETVISGLASACDPVQPIAKERIIAIFDILTKYGFKLDYADAYGNKIMMSAAQFCSVPVIVHLADLGAEINPVNKQNATPLDMAFIRGNWANAEALIDRGARMTKQHADQLFFELPEDPQQRALVERAMQ